MGKYTSVALGVVALSAIISLVLTLLTFFFNEQLPWRHVPWFLLHGMIYGVAIGGIAAPVMEYVAPKIWKYRLLFRWSLVIATLLVAAFAGCLVAVAVIQALGIAGGPYWLYVLRAYGGAAVITLVVGIIGTITESYRERLERTTTKLREHELERERLMKLAGEAQLASIESRIQPHFLFNTLNSISTLIRDDPQTAERLIERLSALLRSSLDTQMIPLVPLRQELKLVEDYLEIQRARFGPRLRFRFEIGPDLEDGTLPPFSVQTLVENSVKYAVAPRREGGSIEIHAGRADERLRVSVADDGPGFDGAVLPPGHGLDNLHSRLMALFGTDAGLDIVNRQAGVSVSFTIPQRKMEPAAQT